MDGSGFILDAAQFKAPDSTSYLAGSNKTAPSYLVRKMALEEKKIGNIAFKNKYFDEAERHYKAAIALDDTEISFVSNLAAVYFERGQWDACIKQCDETVALGQALHANPRMIAKALARKGMALTRKGQLEEAMATFEEALVQYDSADTLDKLEEAKLILKQKNEKMYMQKDKCVEAEARGDVFLRQGLYREALEQFEEAIKRGPPKVNPQAYRLFFKRALSKKQFQPIIESVKDVDTCIELKPDFAKAYLWKGEIQESLSEYEKALETYGKGLDVLPNNDELKQHQLECQKHLSEPSGEAQEYQEYLQFQMSNGK